MSKTTKIEWTEKTWNPVTGCTKVSTGCKHCYAEQMAPRQKGRNGYPADNPFQVTLHSDRLDQPTRWKKPRTVFVCSMGDLFHKDVPEKFIKQVFQVIVDTPQHTYQLLTKRPERAAALATMLPWPENVWMGTSVENLSVMHRISSLVQIPAQIRFLSCEPLLGSLPNLPLDGIHWVIAGAESGQKARPMDENWVRDIRDQCQAASVPFFYKQKHDGGKKVSLPTLDGRQHMGMPGQSINAVKQSLSA